MCLVLTPLPLKYTPFALFCGESARFNIKLWVGQDPTTFPWSSFPRELLGDRTRFPKVFDVISVRTLKLCAAVPNLSAFYILCAQDESCLSSICTASRIDDFDVFGSYGLAASRSAIMHNCVNSTQA